MPNPELSSETLDQIRRTEPLACLLCRDERDEPNYDLRIIDRDASAAQIAVVLRCSAGHVYMNTFIPLDDRVYLGTMLVDLPTGPAAEN